MDSTCVKCRGTGRPHARIVCIAITTSRITVHRGWCLRAVVRVVSGQDVERWACASVCGVLMICTRDTMLKIRTRRPYGRARGRRKSLSSSRGQGREKRVNPFPCTMHYSASAKIKIRYERFQTCPTGPHTCIYYKNITCKRSSPPLDVLTAHTTQNRSQAPPAVTVKCMGCGDGDANYARVRSSCAATLGACRGHILARRSM